MPPPCAPGVACPHPSLSVPAAPPGPESSPGGRGGPRAGAVPAHRCRPPSCRRPRSCRSRGCRERCASGTGARSWARAGSGSLRMGVRGGMEKPAGAAGGQGGRRGTCHGAQDAGHGAEHLGVAQRLHVLRLLARDEAAQHVPVPGAGRWGSELLPAGTVPSPCPAAAQRRPGVCPNRPPGHLLLWRLEHHKSDELLEPVGLQVSAGLLQG